jgi:hypothetical protein
MNASPPHSHTSIAHPKCLEAALFGKSWRTETRMAHRPFNGPRGGEPVDGTCAAESACDRRSGTPGTCDKPGPTSTPSTDVFGAAIGGSARRCARSLQGRPLHQLGLLRHPPRRPPRRPSHRSTSHPPSCPPSRPPPSRPLSRQTRRQTRRLQVQRRLPPRSSRQSPRRLLLRRSPRRPSRVALVQTRCSPHMPA